jgi:hypothetical protein
MGIYHTERSTSKPIIYKQLVFQKSTGYKDKLKGDTANMQTNRRVFRRSTLFLVLLTLCLVLFQNQHPAQAGPVCNFTIGPSVSEANGSSNYSQVRPGHTVCISAGTRGRLTLKNFHGASSQPITFINSGGQVTIQGDPNQIEGGTDALKLESNSYIRITGSGASNQCGARYLAQQQACGIRVTQGFKGVADYRNTNLEIDHLEIYRTGGPGMKLNSGTVGNWTHYNAYVHDIYAHDTGTEGLYIGANYEGVGVNPIFKGLEVSYNRIENTNWSGLDVKSAMENVKIHHNVIINTSLAKTDGGLGIVDSITGDYYNNWIQNIRNSFAFKIKSYGNQRIFNNIVVGAAGNGINWRKGHVDFSSLNDTQIFNNTIAKSGSNGIWIDNASGGGKVFGNIVVSSGGSDIKNENSAKVNVFDNLTGSTTSINFVDPGQNDFHINSDSPAIDFDGRTSPLDFDFDDNPRDSNPDLGAYEFSDTGSAPPTPSPIPSSPTPSPTSPASPTPTPTTPTPTPLPPGDAITLIPSADAFVDAENPTGNYGKNSALKIDGSPTKITYLKFNLTGLATTNINSAQLRLYVVDGSGSTQEIKLANNDWTETGLTYKNRPSPTTVLTSFKDSRTNTWLQVDLTSVIKTYAGRTLSLAIDSGGGGRLKVNSKEAGNNKPHLLIAANGTQLLTAAQAAAPEPASDSTSLVIHQPDSVSAGESFKVSVEAQNLSGEGLYGVQFELKYNPMLLSVSNLQLNPDLSFVVLNNADNTTGKITLAATRQGRVPGLMGNMTLLTFDATALNTAGLAAFTFENVKVSDPHAQAIAIVAQDGTILIGDILEPEPTDEPQPTAEPEPVPTDQPEPVPTDEPEPEPAPTDEPAPEPTTEPEPTPTDQPAPEPTTEPLPEPAPTDEPAPEPTAEPSPEPTTEPEPTPTDEPAPEPTSEPLPEPTAEPEPAPTEPPAAAVVFGQAILAGRAGNNWSNAVITVDDSGQNAATDPAGNFTLANIVTGPHTSITADAPGYLPAVCLNPTAVAPETALLPITLLSGDISDDNLVDISDATAIGASFNLTGPGLIADLNQDQVIDIFDIVLVSLNFGQAGPQPWSCQ